MLNNEVIPVEGSSDLVRDPNSGAIINTNKTAYENALAVAKAAKEKEEKIKSLESDINTIKDDITSMKEMLLQLIKG
jgi:hypothetical protein